MLPAKLFIDRGRAQDFFDCADSFGGLREGVLTKRSHSALDRHILELRGGRSGRNHLFKFRIVGHGFGHRDAPFVSGVLALATAPSAHECRRVVIRVRAVLDTLQHFVGNLNGLLAVGAYAPEKALSGRDGNG